MTLRHLKILVAVFQRSSVTQAARQLHLAQPSVSLAIKELEEYYGIRLFDRIGRRIYPTEAGRSFYGYALHILSLFEELENRMRNWDALGILRVGASVTIGVYLLPALVKQYQQAFPRLRVEVVVGNSGEIEQQILANRIDLGLVETQPDPDSICAEPFMRDSFCAILPPGHPLAGQEAVTLRQLAGYPFLMREPGSAGRQLLDACLSIRQLSVRPAWESASTQALVRAVAAGLGVAVLPARLVERDAREGLVRRLPLREPMERELNLIYHRSKLLTPNMQAFRELCQQFGRQAE